MAYSCIRRLKAKGWGPTPGLGCLEAYSHSLRRIRAAFSMMEPTDASHNQPMVDSDASSESWERVHEDSDAIPPECVGAPRCCWTYHQLQRGKSAACEAPRSLA